MRGSAQRGARPKRNSAQKQGPFPKDQEKKLNPHSSGTHPRKNLDQEATSPALVNTTAPIVADKGTKFRVEIDYDRLQKILDQELKNVKSPDTETLPYHQPRPKQRQRQQRQVDPKLFQDIPPQNTVITRKKRSRQQAHDDSDPDAVFDEVDFALAALEEEHEEDVYHPGVQKQKSLLKKQKPKQEETEQQQQQQEIHFPDVAGVPGVRRARLPRKASAKQLEAAATATAAAAAVKKKKIGAKKAGNKAADATISAAVDAEEKSPACLPPLPASAPPAPSEVLPTTSASVVAAAGPQDQPLSLDAQVKALLIHTATMEERICQKDGEIASLNAIVAALRQTVLMQQNSNGNGAADSAAADSQYPSLPLPLPIHGDVQTVRSLERLDANINSCASHLNHHSKQIQAIISEMNTANANSNYIFTVLQNLRENISNLQHHSMTHAAGVAGCQAEIARIDEFLKEYKKDIKKKVDDFGKAAQGVRPLWDVSPQAAPAAPLF